MARSDYAHITAEQWANACRTTVIFFTGRDPEQTPDTGNTDTRTAPRTGNTEKPHCSVCGRELTEEELANPVVVHMIEADTGHDSPMAWRLCSACRCSERGGEDDADE